MIGLWILLTTSSEDVTFTPGRTKKDAMLHHSLQEQIINNYWRRERKVNMCFVSYEQIYYAKGDSIKLVFDPDAKNQVKACAVNFFLLDSSAFPSPLAVEV